MSYPENLEFGFIIFGGQRYLQNDSHILFRKERIRKIDKGRIELRRRRYEGEKREKEK